QIAAGGAPRLWGWREKGGRGQLAQLPWVARSPGFGVEVPVAFAPEAATAVVALPKTERPTVEASFVAERIDLKTGEKKTVYERPGTQGASLNVDGKTLAVRSIHSNGLAGMDPRTGAPA